MTPPKPPCPHPQWAVNAEIGAPEDNPTGIHQLALTIRCTVCATPLIFTAVNPATLHSPALNLLAIPEDSIWLHHSGLTYVV